MSEAAAAPAVESKRTCKLLSAENEEFPVDYEVVSALDSWTLE